MKQYASISDQHRTFIAQQQMYFVGTAARDGRVNVSPKGLDSLRVVGDHRVLWLNGTGSGNETAAHLLDSPRMTLMFCAFAGKPLILRLYGTARALHEGDPVSLGGQVDGGPPGGDLRAAEGQDNRLRLQLPEPSGPDEDRLFGTRS